FNFPGNWTNGQPAGAGATANLLNFTTARRTVSVDSAVTVGTINFNQSLGYVLGGTGRVTMAGAGAGAAINAQSSGTQTISAPLRIGDATTISAASGATLLLSGALDNSAGKMLTKTGSGTVSISGP